MRRASMTAAAIVAFGLIAGAAQADTQALTVTLHPAAGDPIAVADLTLDSDGRYALAWRDALFSEHFLSMRPFKCLDGPEKIWCRVPYPYENPPRIAAGDLTALEYDLLFVWKDAGAYGVDFWNGVYYRLAPDAAGGFEGALHEFTLDVLASPPEPAGSRPIGEADLEPGDPASHWLPRLSIGVTIE